MKNRKKQLSENKECSTQRYLSEIQHRNRRELKGSKRKQYSELAADLFRIPDDFSVGSMKVTLTGNGRMWIENYLCILEFTSEKIGIQGRHFRLYVEGGCLKLNYLTGDDLMITGKIQSVSFER